MTVGEKIFELLFNLRTLFDEGLELSSVKLLQKLNWISELFNTREGAFCHKDFKYAAL